MSSGNMEFGEKCKHAACRSCENPGLLPVLDLGQSPLADGLRTQEQLSQPEPKFPLQVAFCVKCSLVQILETVPPQELFLGDYPYYSSFSPALLAHSRDNALDLIQRRKLDSSSLVVELASNDGYLLKNFVENGVPVLGIDPAPGPAAAAQRAGVRTMNTFFGLDLAGKLREQGHRADVIIGNNVLAHVADTNGFVKGIHKLLKDDGEAVIEVPYVRDLIDHGEFDTIYHEHLCYFSATSVDALFRRNGLYLNDVKRLSIHGGSLRLYFGPTENVRDSVKNLLAEERKLGVDKYPYFEQFAKKVTEVRRQLRILMDDLRGKSKRIAAYGAAAKGTTLLNYVGIGTDQIDFVVDRNVHKHGKFMPGVHIPIAATEKLAESQPDYVLLLAWNFKEEIMAQQSDYVSKGGKFIVPIPMPQVV